MMKKMLTIGFVLIIATISITGCSLPINFDLNTIKNTVTNKIANTNLFTLEQITQKIPTLKTLETFQQAGHKYSTEVVDNTITVLRENAQYPSFNSKLTFTLDGSVLSSPNIGMAEQDMVMCLLVAIQALHGQDEDEVLLTLNKAEETKIFTVVKEGVEFIDIGGNRYSVSVDINKKLPLADTSKFYFKPTDLEEWSSILKNGSMTKATGGLTIDTKTSGATTKITITENGKLSERAYKSLLSIIEVLYENKKVADYFVLHYKDFSKGNVEFEGFKIEIGEVADGQQTANIMATRYK